MNDDAGLPSEKGYETRPACPCCGAPSSESTPVVVSTPPAETLPVDRHSGFVSGYASGRLHFTYCECSRCEARYCPIFYTQDKLQELYGRQAENMSEVPLMARERAQIGYAQLLMKHSRRDAGFLEIGADIGLFAENCAAQGQFNNFWLFEPNEDVHSKLAERLGGLPYTIHASMSPSEEVPARSVSTAALIHVLDHLLDPASFLAKIREKLTDDGVVLVVTHNTASLLARILGRRWPPYALQHPQLYSPRSITRLFERAGFEIVEITGAVNYFPLMHLLNAGLMVLGMPDWGGRVQGPIIPIKLGNMAIVARNNAPP
jgi:2-polyprenyl-3-methyl-5-hydroxy-6-metoxy-1,4-benzoquinol methylase